MNTFNVFLLDDDSVFLNSFAGELAQYLKTLPHAFELHCCTSAAELEKMAEQLEPDLIIADIKLSEDDTNGISVLRNLRSKGCKAEIIFLTGYLHYATDIFSLHPIYFMLKTEYKQRMQEAIGIFLEKTRRNQSVLSVTIGKSTEFIPINSITYIERCMRKTIVHCENGSISITAPLHHLKLSLPPKRFAFSHQSILVNLSFVKSFKAAGLILSNGSELPISRSRLDMFCSAMADYLGDSNS